MRQLTRRSLLQAGAAGLVLSPTTVNLANATSLTLQTFTRKEYQTVVALAEILVPGAEQAGIGLFLDQNLARKLEHCVLMIKYLNVPEPYLEFYRTGLDNVQSFCERKHGAPFADIPQDDQRSLVDAIANDAVADWQGPPAGFFHFVLRADAVDVVYGTVSGFDRLNIPYKAHIAPHSDW